MRILLAVAAVVAMVAACQVEPEPNATSIPAVTSRHIDSAVTGCRDAAFTRYATAHSVLAGRKLSVTKREKKHVRGIGTGDYCPHPLRCRRSQLIS